MSSAEHLVHMANDIGNFFRANPDHDAAVRAISNHIKSFWTPKMRKKLIADMNAAHAEEANSSIEELDELPREALLLLMADPDFKAHQLPEGGPEGGGDAG
jgi:formate dehydrogenase subunit delta